MKLIVSGFLICQVCMYFMISGPGSFYTISAYAFWIGILLAVFGLLFSDK